MPAGSAARAGAASIDYGEGAATVAADDADASGAPPTSVRIEGIARAGRRAGATCWPSTRRSRSSRSVAWGCCAWMAMPSRSAMAAPQRSAPLEIGEPLMLFDLALDYGGCARDRDRGIGAGHRRAPRRRDRPVPGARQEGVGDRRPARDGGDANRGHARERGRPMRCCRASRRPTMWTRRCARG